MPLNIDRTRVSLSRPRLETKAMPERFKCPACSKASTKTGVILHFQQALTGWDSIVWDPIAQPHKEWVESEGVPTEAGWLYDNELLKAALHKYFDTRGK